MNQSEKQRIYDLLEGYKGVASRISFEILETEEIQDYEIVTDFIQKVKKYGCGISIDDFGSGYSNFEKLLQLDIDTVKIDGTLIKDIDKSAHARLVVGTIVQFAKEAGFFTVAEYVHSEDVLHEVKELGVDYAQGFHLGKPLPAKECFIL